LRHKIQTIQNLRGFAALAVLIHHVFLDTKKYGSESYMIDNFYSLDYFGNIGVDIFFVISGFIMVLIHGSDFKKFHGIRTFFLKRIIRIVPIYWLLTGVAAFILFFFPHLFGAGKTFDLYHTIASFLFIPWNNTAGMPIPILAAGWTLNYEMYFYCIFALFLLFSKNKFIPGITIYFIISIFLHYFFENNHPSIAMATNPLLLEFLFGIYIGTMYRNKIFIKQYKLLLGISMILVLSNIPFSHSISYRVIYFGIPAALLIYSLLVYEHNNNLRFMLLFPATQLLHC